MFYKKKLFVVAMTFTLFLMTLFTNAQTVIVKLKHPPPHQWHVEDLWQLTLTNTSQESYNVYLYGTVEEADAGLIIEGTSATFELPANFSGPVNRGDLDPANVGYTNGDYEEIVMRTGTLPEGTYTICVYVKNYETDEQLGYDCIIQSILHPSPPELIFPTDETIIEEDLPVFVWLPPMPINEFVSYTIKIVELMDGQVPIEAMEANPAFYIEEDIPATSYQFPISAREFEQGVTYAWQITAFIGDFDDTEDWMGGKSEVWEFTYSHKIIQFKLKLLTPGLVEEIKDPYPLFSWSISDNLENYYDINYTLKIFEMDTTSEPIDYSVEKPDVMIETQNTFYQYSENDIPFKQGKAYVWWVEAKTGIDIKDIAIIEIDITDLPPPELFKGPHYAHIIFYPFRYYDYGDAPDELDNPKYHYCSHNFLTCIAAKHCDFSKEWLGNFYAPDSCNCPGPSATEEKDAKTIDLDEYDNGVKFTKINLNPCDIQTVQVLINVEENYTRSTERYSSGKLHLHAWFDWNRDGDWDDKHPCKGVPADDHIYWLTAKPLCGDDDDDSVVIPFDVNSCDFEIDPFWLYKDERYCEIYELTFLAGDNSFASGANSHVTGDTLWCRFRLSYDGDGGTIANNYHGGVKFGEVEDYPLCISDINRCQCTIKKVKINGTTVSGGEEISIRPPVVLPVSRNFDVTADCGDCTTSYKWKITKPGGSVDTYSNRTFTYTFTTNGVYSFVITVTCSDGTTCSQTFSINVNTPIIAVPIPIPIDTIVGPAHNDTIFVEPRPPNDTLR